MILQEDSDDDNESESEDEEVTTALTFVCPFFFQSYCGGSDRTFFDCPKTMLSNNSNELMDILFLGIL